MVIPLALAVAALALALAIWAGVHALRDRAVMFRQLEGAAVVEAGLVVEAIVAVVLAAGGEQVQQAGLFWVYVLVTLAILPVAGAWAFAERTRWSSVVMVFAAVTVAILQWRLVQIWGTS